MPEENLKVTFGKLALLIPKSLLYSEAGAWVKLEGDRVRFGLSHFPQQQSGDVALAKIKAVGTELEPGDEFADIETVKVDVGFPSPVKGTIVEFNSRLQGAAELVNQDPYGKGWLAVVEAANGARGLANGTPRPARSPSVLGRVTGESREAGERPCSGVERGVPRARIQHLCCCLDRPGRRGFEQVSATSPPARRTPGFAAVEQHLLTTGALPKRQQ